MAAEVNRRYRSELKKPHRPANDLRCLRPMATAGEVRLVKKGTAHIPAVHAKP